VVIKFFLLAIGAGLGGILGPSHAKSTSVIFPHGALEMAFWAVISLTAGIVEELVYRGYLQTQLARMGLPVGVAILVQAAIFFGRPYIRRPQRGNRHHCLCRALWPAGLLAGMIGHFALDFLAAFLARM